MRRVVVRVALAVVAVSAIGTLWLYDRITALEVEQITGDVHVLFGAGGNVGVLATGAGAVIVDTLTFRSQGVRVRERAEELGRGPVQAVLNTHYHQDHTHGNLGFAAGTRIVAAARTLDYLRHFDAAYWEEGAEEMLPNELVSDVHELSIGSKTVRSFHLGRGHTGGDLVVLFVEDRVLHSGDLLFNGLYPLVDLEGGGSLAAWIETLDRVLELDFDHVIPGHGPVAGREAIEGFQRFLLEVWRVGQAAAAQGLSLDEMLAGASLTSDAGYAPGGLPPFVVFERDDVLRQAWEEATGSVVALDVPTTEAP
ncbi:MAG: MBL fold metallo-hydrolase [Deltaproteobacteria bacterium]|nr:MBL fold metallo-hydrolase [Deltaproteobacteria bacterium]MBW2360900.1 MBL fold metallo-hydrolase [Deltaproteobacteria bacterium]